MATILVVDDRPTNRQFLLTLLGYADHRLLEAGDGAQALELVRSEHPDLVITDILMPTMDGYEFVQRLRSEPEITATPVIFYTATYSATEAKSLARSCGVAAVLPKPCEPQEIFAAVNRALGADVPLPDIGTAMEATGAKEVRELHKIGDKLSDYLGELGSVKETIEGLIGRGEKLGAERKRLKQLSLRFAENLVNLQGVAARLTALEDLGAELMAERKPERIVTTFLGAATRIVGSSYSAIGILDEREQELLFLRARGLEAEILRDAGLDRARLPGSLLDARKPVRSSPSRATAPVLPTGHPPVRNFLGLRIATDTHVYGWLYFAGKLGAEEFSDEDERLAATMVAQLALLYDNASLYHLIQHHAAQLQIEVNERRRAQEALQESKAGLHRAQVMAKIAHVITGPEGEFLSWSENFPELIGIDSARIPRSTREWLEILHPEDRELFRDHSIQAGRTGERLVLEYRLRRTDGSWTYIDHVSESLEGGTDAAGGPRWFGTLRDVTEQKRANFELQRFRAAMDLSMDAIYLIDPVAMRYVYVNNTVCQLLGYRREQLLQMSPQDVQPVEREQLQREFDEVIAAGERGMRLERGFVRSDGSAGWTELHRRALSAGDRTLIVSLGRDITERKRAEQIRALEHGVVLALAVADTASAGLQAAMRLVCETEGWEFGRYWRFDEGAGGLRFADSWSNPGVGSDGVIATTNDIVFPPGVGLVGRVLQSGEPLWIADISKDDRVLQKDLARSACMRGAFVFPVTFEARTVGVLAFASREIREPDEKLTAAVRVIGAQIGQFLRRKLDEDRVRRLNRVHAVLSGVNTLIVRARDRDELFREACRIAVEQGEFGMAWIGEFDRATHEVTPVAWNGLDEDAPMPKASAHEDVPEGKGMVGRAIRAKKPVITNDISADPAAGGPRRAEALRKGMQSIIAMPLMVDGEVRATLTLFARERAFFNDAELKLLTELAGDISFAIDNIEKRNRLDYLAFYDQLTGLANRSLFSDRLMQLIRSAARADAKAAVAKFDIERLRAINESFGRQAGDEVHKETAARLTRAFGATSIGRVSANHFAVLLEPIKGRSEAERRAQEITRACFDAPFQVAGSELRLSAKCGIALFPGDGADAETLLGNAEAALRKAKEIGERHVLYTPDLTERTGVTLTLETKLRLALEREEFVLHYQPKVDMETRRIVGVEALIRWQSPELGLVPPGKFIPLLEETGMILEVGGWALQRAAGDHRSWVEKKLPAPRVAVNVSAIQLRKKDFVASVEQAIMEGVAPAGIDLEITESLIMVDIQDNIEKLKAARALGMSIAIDDFGTGYSSLGYLAKLPVNALKIDRSFIITMLGDPDAMTLVQTIISLAHSLRLKVVAEGVETEDQAKMLRLLRCDQMQGYLFSKPVPFDDLTALLKTSRELR